MPHVFTKDLDQLAADLKATDDQAAVIQRYKDALAVKREVRCGFQSDLNFFVFTYPEVWASAGKDGRSRESGQGSCNHDST